MLMKHLFDSGWTCGVSPACIGNERRGSYTLFIYLQTRTGYADAHTQYNFRDSQDIFVVAPRPIVRPRPPPAPLPAPPHPSRPIRNHRYSWKCCDCPLIKVSVPMHLRGKVPLKQHFRSFVLISPDF